MSWPSPVNRKSFGGACAGRCSHISDKAIANLLHMDNMLSQLHAGPSRPPGCVLRRSRWARRTAGAPERWRERRALETAACISGEAPAMPVGQSGGPRPPKCTKLALFPSHHGQQRAPDDASSGSQITPVCRRSAGNGTGATRKLSAAAVHLAGWNRRERTVFRLASLKAMPPQLNTR